MPVCLELESSDPSRRVECRQVANYGRRATESLTDQAIDTGTLLGSNEGAASQQLQSLHRADGCLDLGAKGSNLWIMGDPPAGGSGYRVDDRPLTGDILSLGVESVHRQADLSGSVLDPDLCGLDHFRDEQVDLL